MSSLITKDLRTFVPDRRPGSRKELHSLQADAAQREYIHQSIASSPPQQAAFRNRKQHANIKAVFTGIVEEVGTVGRLDAHATGARLRIQCSTVTSDAYEGSSIAVNGVCLTALNIDPEGFEADLAPETLRRTNLGDLQPGTIVNLERPLLATGRLSGHVVQGHVDGTGEFVSMDVLGDDNYWLRIRIPAELDRYVIYKGSIAIDGISLTVASIEDRVLSVTIIPHTYQATALRVRAPGSRVNLECDIFAKYLEKMVKGYSPAD